MKVGNLIHIDAPPDVVWAVTEDIERWPEWTPTVQSAKRLDNGSFDVGSAAVLKQSGLPESEWIVTELVRGERLIWESRIHGARVIGTHEVRPADRGAQSQLYVEIAGVAASLLWPLIGLLVRQSIKRENAGLKVFCEERHRTAEA